MTDYPTDHGPITDALMAWTPPPELETAIDFARAIGSPPVREVATFDVLKDHIATLDADGLRLLCGCAHILSRFNFHDRAEVAIPVLLAANAARAALPAPPPSPAPEGETP